MPRYKMTGRRGGTGSSLANKIKDLKKQIKQLKTQAKKIKIDAHEEAYRKAMAEILKEIRKRDAARDKAVKAAGSRFEKDYDSVLAKKAKVRKPRVSGGAKRGRRPKTGMTVVGSEGGVARRRGRPPRKVAGHENG